MRIIFTHRSKGEQLIFLAFFNHYTQYVQKNNTKTTFMKKTLFLLCIFLTCTNVFAKDMDWMSEIPNDRIFNQLIIPGTHDSGSYNINVSSPFSLSNDDPLPEWIEILNNILPNYLVQSVVAGWSKTQPETISQQLSAGIRYLDFRVAIYPGDNHFYLSHALLSVRLTEALSQVQMFAAMNPSEIIIVDINHVLNVSNSTQQERLVSLLQTYLGQYLIPNNFKPTDTIGTLRAHGNVIVLMDTTQPIYTPSLAQFSAQYFWHQSNINSPWANASTTSTLKSALDAEMSARATTTDSKFFVLQSILSESTNQIIAGILDPTHNPNSIQSLSTQVNNLLTDWLYGYFHAYGANKMNIVIQDWYNNQSSLVPLAMQYDTAPQIKKTEDKTLPEKIDALKTWWGKRQKNPSN